MSLKIGRNDPCTCGSGKKYKQCCLQTAQEMSDAQNGHDGAIERAVEWLMSRHKRAVMDSIQDMLFEELSNEQQDNLETLNAEIWQGIQLNATEWLIAEGDILVKDEYHLVSDLLLGTGGLLLTVGQRQWIKQLSERPLRLYDVTAVIPGQQMTLCDALEPDMAPIIVSEKSGSQASQIGMRLGVRIMEVEGHHELSGGVYQFSHFAGAALLEALKESEQEFNQELEDFDAFVSFMIRRKWLEQYINPVALPTMMDQQSGEAILFVTDHYRVKDWDKLSQILSSKMDIDGDRATGWSRLKEFDDGLMRATSSIGLGSEPDKIELFHKTQTEADQGRKWFDELVGDAVQFSGRVISDPKGLLKNPPSSKPQKSPSQQSAIPPEIAADLIEQAIHRMYANWVDEPLAALNGKSPKQAITSAADLERVKGLLRTYQAGEQQQAAEQGRRAVSYQFLWDAIGLVAE